jgi:para-aminobenzoate synthetase/4-amino-4-deoxychorismate lyase
MKQEGTAICRLPGGDPPRWGLFRAPGEVITARRPAEVPTAVERLEQALAAGYAVAGFLAYEAAPAFDRHFRVIAPPDAEPSVCFAIYRQAPAIIELPLVNDFKPDINFTPELTRAAYTQALTAIRDRLIAGDIYQANFTFRCHCAASPEEPERLFLSLCSRHPVPYAAFLNFGDRKILSLSPELFLERNREYIVSSPMKGTVKREPDADRDAQAACFLANDEKNRAENLMITDMVRNDLGRICRPGSVRVDPLFQVKTYRTVHQMISTVHGELADGVSLKDILGATFPAASITGAPKIRAMEVIAENEHSPRGVYCGAVGCFLSASSFCLNVPIRTLTWTPAETRLGIGGGIVLDSEPESEWREALLKSRFVHFTMPEFQVFETIGWEAGRGYLFPEEHLARMRKSQYYFGRPWREKEIRDALAVAEKELHAQPQLPGHRGVRLTLTHDGAGHGEITPPRPPWRPEGVRLKLAAIQVDSGDLFLYHKTTFREIFDREYRKALQEGFDEVLFCNEKGFLTEGAISSLFIRRDGQWLTPRLSNGLLPGVWRQAQLRLLEASEADLRPEDLEAAQEIRIGNSVRGGGQVGPYPTEI